MAENLCPTPRNLTAGAGGHSPIVEAGWGSLSPFSQEAYTEIGNTYVKLFLLYTALTVTVQCSQYPLTNHWGYIMFKVAVTFSWISTIMSNCLRCLPVSPLMVTSTLHCKALSSWEQKWRGIKSFVWCHTFQKDLGFPLESRSRSQTLFLHHVVFSASYFRHLICSM